MDKKLEIAFPKSSEDQRLQLVSVNESIFAIVHSPLESDGPIRLNCEEWSLILLAPIKSQTNIVITARNVICLNEIASEKGNVTLHASNRLVKFAHSVKPNEKRFEFGERGEFQFTDDPGIFLYFYRLFDGIVTLIRSKDPKSLAEAQQNFITGLFTLADKIEESPENLDLDKILKLWDIHKD